MLQSALLVWLGSGRAIGRWGDEDREREGEREREREKGRRIVDCRVLEYLL